MVLLLLEKRLKNKIQLYNVFPFLQGILSMCKLLQHILLRQRPFKLCKNPVSINDNACIQICHGKQKPDIKHINFERIQIHEINFPYRKRSSLIKRFIVRPPCQWNLYVAFLITLYHISLWQSRQHF